MLIDSIPGCSFPKKMNFFHFSQDSREIFPKKTLFFALKGQKIDGHHFLKEVAEKQALAAVVDASYQGPDFGLWLYRSKNVLLSLQELARQELLKKDTKIVGVTGSLGKTTTTTFLNDLLKNCTQVEKSPKSYNTQITLPLNILNLTLENPKWLILEMGMSKQGELLRLVDLAPPDLALITKLAYVHAENFDSLEEIAKSKLEIFSKKSTKHRLASDQLLPFLPKEINCKIFSLENMSADFSLKKTGQKWTFFADQQKVFDFPEFSFFSKVFMENLLAALSAAYELKFPMEKIKENIFQLKLPPQRQQILKKKKVVVINDAYNSNLVSLKAALDLLKTFTTKKIAVLAEMRELGKFSKQCHEEAAIYALNIVDTLFCIGNETQSMHQIFLKKGKESYYFENKEKLIESLLPFLKSGDTVLLKGSRFWELETILDQIE